MSHAPFDLTGKTALVTGASSGLGVAFAEGLAAAGANVVVVARREDRLREVADRVAARGGEVLAARCDVGEADEVQGVVDAAVDRFGRLDVVVANAGVAADAGPMAEHLPDAMFEETVRQDSGASCAAHLGAGLRGAHSRRVPHRAASVMAWLRKPSSARTQCPLHTGSIQGTEDAALRCVCSHQDAPDVARWGTGSRWAASDGWRS